MGDAMSAREDAEMAKQIEVGDVVTGVDNDSETGVVGAIEGDQVTVGWESCCRTTQSASCLRLVDDSE